MPGKKSPRAPLRHAATSARRARKAAVPRQNPKRSPRSAPKANKMSSSASSASSSVATPVMVTKAKANETSEPVTPSTPTAAPAPRRPPRDDDDDDAARIRVMVRCRPFLPGDVQDEEEPRTPFNVDLRTAQVVLREGVRKTVAGDEAERVFAYDHVFGTNASQQDVFDQCMPLVDSVLDGFNATIFAYGQSGSGKTHTLIDDDGGKGILPRAMERIFGAIAAASSDKEIYLVHCQYVEIYNEVVYDLLVRGEKQLETKRTKSGFVLKHVRDVPVRDMAGIDKLLEQGKRRRTMASTSLNDRSSRSHCIFSIIVECSVRLSDDTTIVRVGKLNCVDLAGSERLSQSKVEGVHKREAGAINQSLFALGRVINALADRATATSSAAASSMHIPYRAAKLTMLLKDSLGGNARTLVIATVRPEQSHANQSVSTLRFAEKLKLIKNRPIVNEDPRDAVLRKLQQELEYFKRQLAEAKAASTSEETSAKERRMHNHVNRFRAYVMQGGDDHEAQPLLQLMSPTSHTENVRELTNRRQHLGRTMSMGDVALRAMIKRALPGQAGPPVAGSSGSGLLMPPARNSRRTESMSGLDKSKLPGILGEVTSESDDDDETDTESVTSSVMDMMAPVHPRSSPFVDGGIKLGVSFSVKEEEEEEEEEDEEKEEKKPAPEHSLGDVWEGIHGEPTGDAEAMLRRSFDRVFGGAGVSFDMPKPRPVEVPTPVLPPVIATPVPPVPARAAPVVSPLTPEEQNQQLVENLEGIFDDLVAESRGSDVHQHHKEEQDKLRAQEEAMAARKREEMETASAAQAAAAAARGADAVIAEMFARFGLPPPASPENVAAEILAGGVESTVVADTAAAPLPSVPQRTPPAPEPVTSEHLPASPNLFSRISPSSPDRSMASLSPPARMDAAALHSRLDRLESVAAEFHEQRAPRPANGTNVENVLPMSAPGRLVPWRASPPREPTTPLRQSPHDVTRLGRSSASPNKRPLRGSPYSPYHYTLPTMGAVQSASTGPRRRHRHGRTPDTIGSGDLEQYYKARFSSLRDPIDA